MKVKTSGQEVSRKQFEEWPQDMDSVMEAVKL